MEQNQPGCNCGTCAYCVTHGKGIAVAGDAHLRVTGFESKKKKQH